MCGFQFGGRFLEFGLPVRSDRFEGNIVRFPIPENMVREFETEFLSGLQAELCVTSGFAAAILNLDFRLGRTGLRLTQTSLDSPYPKT